MKKILFPLLAALVFIPRISVAEAPPADAATRGPTQNVILMIADGGGFNHFRAASAYMTGQATGLIWNSFPVRLAVSTFSASGQGYDPGRAARDAGYFREKPTDSAAAATAMATGFKTSNGSLGVDTEGRPLPSVVEAAQKAGKAAGLVTTVPFSHATPAGFGAHVRDRGKYADIAEELVERSSLTVLMGGGHPLFDVDGKARMIGKFYAFVGGSALWDRIARNEAGRGSNGTAAPWTRVQDRAAFAALATGAAPARVLGVAPVYKTLQQERTPGKDWNGDGKITFADAAAAPAFGDPLTSGMPTLVEMVRGALNVMDDNPRGFFLMIEGGAVDWASHQNQSGRMIEEMIGFLDAVQAVCDWVEANGGWENNLLIITADHETGWLQGPPVAGVDSNCPPVAVRGKGEMPGMVWKQVNHTNQLVPLFAKGRRSNRFAELIRGRDAARGDYVDNTDIARVLFEAIREP